MHVDPSEYQALQDRVAELERLVAEMVPMADLLGLAGRISHAQGYAEGRASVLGPERTRPPRGRQRHLQAVRSAP